MEIALYKPNFLIFLIMSQILRPEWSFCLLVILFSHSLTVSLNVCELVIDQFITVELDHTALSVIACSPHGPRHRIFLLYFYGHPVDLITHNSDCKFTTVKTISVLW